MTIIEIDLQKLERGTHIGNVKVTRKGKTFWRKQRIGRKEEKKDKIIPESDITDKYDVGYDTLKFNSTKMVVGEYDIYISREVGYFLKKGGEATNFKGKVVIGREDWVGKDIKEIPEIINEVNGQYAELEKLKIGGDFSKVEMVKSVNSIASILGLYKSTIGSSTFIMSLAEAYLKNGIVEIPDIDNRLDEEYNELKEYLKDHKSKLYTRKMAEMEDIKIYNKSNLIGDHRNIISKLDQNAVNEFYSEVERTQKDLKERFGNKSTITLYRGVQGDYAEQIKSELDKNSEVDIETYDISSWTSNATMAYEFSGLGSGIVIKKEIPIKDILFSHFTSPYIRTSDYVFGGSPEYEFIVGNKDRKMKLNKEEIDL